MNNKDYTLLASICRDDTSALNAILYNNSKATSASVAQDMLFKTVNNKCEDTKFLAMFDYAMAVDLKEAGFNNVYFTTDCPVIIRKTKEGLEAKTGIKVLTLKEIEDMKFDVTVGNPPFSSHAEGKTAGKRGKELYIVFYKLALEISEVVAMVMPTTDKKVQRVHNKRLSDTANVIEYIDPSVFSGINMPMWYVISDKSKRKPDVDFSLLSEVRNDIEWMKGKVNMTQYKERAGDHGKEKQSKEFPVKMYHKLNGKDGLLIRYGKGVFLRRSMYFPNSGYAVLMPQTITDDGWTVVKIVKCTGKEVAFNGMNIVFTKTKKDAIELVNVMNTDNFKQQANKVKQGFNNMHVGCLRAIKL